MGRAICLTREQFAALPIGHTPAVRQAREQHSRQGRKARNNGELFQNKCASDAYTSGAVHLTVIPPGCRWTIQRGRPTPVAVKTMCDFAGAVPSLNGRAMFFDAKSISADSGMASFPLHPPTVKPHQIKELRAMSAGGLAICGFLVECGPMGDVRWIDVEYCEGERVRWDSPRWLILNPIGDRIGFDFLITAYGGTPPQPKTLWKL